MVPETIGCREKNDPDSRLSSGTGDSLVPTKHDHDMLKQLPRSRTRKLHQRHQLRLCRPKRFHRHLHYPQYHYNSNNSSRVFSREAG
uniref:Uncharacterized protein n=1 Tax=Steinernema glaseri TaxID=37863 RepID=A0A1I8A997_9BILA